MTEATSEKGQLLVIDDEAEIIKSLRRQFRKEYVVHLANSADEGYAIMQEHSIQVIISDQRMPGMTGSEFYEKVRGEFPDAIRLLLTGYADINAVIQAINDGHIFRYITKPWDPTELQTVVREAFERHRLIVTNRKLLKDLQEANATLEERVEERTRELSEANTELTQLNRQKDEFLGMAAHDLRNPIGAVYGFAALMLGHPGITAADTRKYLESIQRSSKFMLGILNDLLDITTIARGRVELRLGEVDFARFLKRVASLNELMATQKDIRLTTDLPANLPVIRADGDRIEQVLNNLLSNAFKFSHSGTKVVLRARPTDDGGVRIEVDDEGQGIKADELDGLFGSFQKTSTRATGGEKSTGLGLAICKSLVEHHGGEIGVDSEHGEGSVFWFTLPARPSAK